MAYIKIFPIKITVNKALKYITNPDKTDEKLLISSFACSPETADLEFALTRKEGKNNIMDKGNNLAFHLIQSFKPGEVDTEAAHRLGKLFVDKVLKGKYEYVISTHTDRNHIHNHIIFNATSFVDQHKYISNKRSYYKICRISNRICQENGLATSMPTGEKGKSYKENMEYHRGTSWKAKLKVAVDKAIWSSINYEEFLLKMQQSGYEIRQGKYLAFRAPEQKHFTNMKSLGIYYTENNILLRLENNRHKIKSPKNLSKEIRLFINISSFVETGNRKGFEHWATLNNLKEAARTFNYLSENHLLNYEDFQNHIHDIDESLNILSKQIIQLDTNISHEQLIKKYCNSYRTIRKIIENEKNTTNPHQYRVKYRAEYQIHDTLKRQLLELGIKKIPSFDHQNATIKKLENEREVFISERLRLEKERAFLSIIQNNFCALLNHEDLQNLQISNQSL